MNLYNVSGESIKCYSCSSNKNNKCADPINESGLETSDCMILGLKEAFSAAFAGEDVPDLTKMKFACLKTVYKGKKF
jgi:hypothetical protein